MTSTNMTPQEVQARINALETEMAHPKTYPTEIYTRIVGYYRSLANWNAGKREEYNHRVTFSEAEATTPHAQAAGKATSWLVFVKEHCPQCPAMKAKLPLLPFEGKAFDVETTEGFTAAVDHEVLVTPTLILLDGAGHEVLRITSALDWARIEAAL